MNLLVVFVTSVRVPKNLHLISPPTPSQRNFSMHPKTVMIELPLVPTLTVSAIAVVCVCVCVWVCV